MSDFLGVFFFGPKFWTREDLQNRVGDSFYVNWFGKWSIGDSIPDCLKSPSSLIINDLIALPNH